MHKYPPKTEKHAWNATTEDPRSVNSIYILRKSPKLKGLGFAAYPLVYIILSKSHWIKYNTPEIEEESIFYSNEVSADDFHICNEKIFLLFRKLV